MKAFYEKAMGFRLSDWIGDYFAFMRCGVDHHTVNFLKNPNSQQMQHIARHAGLMHRGYIGRQRRTFVPRDRNGLQPPRARVRNDDAASKRHLHFTREQR